MAIIDARRVTRTFTERSAELRQRTVALLNVVSGGAAMTLLDTEHGRAALDALVAGSLGIKNAITTFEATSGSADAAGALSEAATAYQRARVAIDAAIAMEVARRLGVTDVESR